MGKARAGQMPPSSTGRRPLAEATSTMVRTPGHERIGGQPRHGRGPAHGARPAPDRALPPRKAASARSGTGAQPKGMPGSGISGTAGLRRPCAAARGRGPAARRLEPRARKATWPSRPARPEVRSCPGLTDIRRSFGDRGMRAQRVEHLLFRWARLMRRPQAGRGLAGLGRALLLEYPPISIYRGCTSLPSITDW